MLSLAATILAGVIPGKNGNTAIIPSMDKYQKVGVCAYIQRGDGKFLVVHRRSKDDFQPGLYDLPGGEVEFGETPVEALLREVMEETKLKVKILTPTFVYSNVQKEIRHQFWIIYKCEYLGGEICLDRNDHDEYKWVSIEEARKLATIIFLSALLYKL